MTENRQPSPATRRPKRGAESRPNLWALLALGVLPLLLLELVPIPVLDSFENAAYDARMRLRDRVSPGPSIVSGPVMSICSISRGKLYWA